MASVTYVISTGEIVAFCSGPVSTTQAVLEIEQEQLEQIVAMPGYTVENGVLVAPATSGVT
ncbi:hypothetical protein F4827_001695 [Paraburkholderia bannensis]|uniref:Uncharacterized protein n=1 Tax=Paraburkholderia bannensis TaxID=765414 RepID=A0A7W9WS21_9BURK|nr:MULTISPECIES: hypothetical protein [Paraburkholderia]MBB3256849.1 hypothetical protein [Paraburkholderia sp. WP4_3_2]MBB6101847.1 hypothetical protein [Paraburkholderia bannensis]